MNKLCFYTCMASALSREVEVNTPVKKQEVEKSSKKCFAFR